MTKKRHGLSLLFVGLVWGGLVAPGYARTKKVASPAELRTDYISRVEEQQMPQAERTVGSLWVPSDVSELSSDYKARKLNDTVVILVAVQTKAAQSGDVNSSRAF